MARIGLASLFALAAVPCGARADVTAPVVLAGPSHEIAEFGGIAIASDGTGGAIWRQAGDGGSHIYVSRYAVGRWTAPIRVDSTLPYDSFEPRIAASPGGQLVAIWAQDYAHRGANKIFRLSSSVMKAGSTAFEPPVTIDGSVGSDLGTADDIDPVFRLNDAGIGYVAYRVTTKSANATKSAGTFPPGLGRTTAFFRVARFNGGVWNSMGAVNRNIADGSPTYSEPAPAPGNGPQVSVDRFGNGVVAFLEPDGTSFDRVWARRMFSTRLGNVLRVSPLTIGGQPLNGSADAFALAGGGAGAAAVVVRQQPGRPSPLSGARMFFASMPDPSQAAAQFDSPAQLDDASGLYSVPAVAMDRDELVSLAFGASGSVLSAGTTLTTGLGPLQDISSGPVLGAPQTTAGPGPVRATAWSGQHDGSFGVAISQSLAGTAARQAFVAGPLGGPVADLAFGGSGLGDGLVGFRQGEGDSSEIVVAAAQVPPQTFIVYPPLKWVRPQDATISWDRALSGVGGLTYDVLVDGAVRARRLLAPPFSLPPDGLDDGPHRVNVRATDASGQSALGQAVTVNVDRTPPGVVVVVGKQHRISIHVRDRNSGTTGHGSGVNPDRVRVRFGDGTTAGGSRVLQHRYSQRGRYRIRVKTADAAGNLGTTFVRVTIR